jgi:hypothetical protein
MKVLTGAGAKWSRAILGLAPGSPLTFNAGHPRVLGPELEEQCGFPLIWREPLRAFY